MRRKDSIAFRTWLSRESIAYMEQHPRFDRGEMAARIIEAAISAGIIPPELPKGGGRGIRHRLQKRLPGGGLRHYWAPPETFEKLRRTGNVSLAAAIAIEWAREAANFDPPQV